MSESVSNDSIAARILDLGEIDYERAREMQIRLVDERIEGKIDDTFIFVSHPPTITIGRGANRDNILVSDDVLQQRGVKVYEVERGGDVTFHGPGQQIIYPIVDLDRRGRDLHKFLRDLEGIVIEFLANYDLRGERLPGKTGVWIDGKKICAIGIAVKRWVSYHGLALNLDTNLTFFSLINPCGFDPDSVTSLYEQLDGPIDKPRIFFELVSAIEKVFGTTITF